MREALLEARCCRRARAEGWLCFKFSSPGQRGVPDRIFVRGGRVVFVELKAPGRPTTRLQDRRIADLRREGAEVHVLDSFPSLAAVLGLREELTG